MTNTVLATKWRPKLFSDLIGQEPVVTALVNSLDNDRLHHSYLFTGTRGIGKTTLARILAKCLNCENNGITSSPCGECSSCISIDAGQFVDLYEVDAASKTKVEDTRELLDNVQYMPTQGRYKIYIIDEVHMLSTHSFNALLKTLEEPPEHVKFILATTDPQKIPSTILSRCLHFNLNRIPSEIIKTQLEKILNKENITFEETAIKNISKIADGSMRDAISLTEQCISHGDNNITDNNISKILCLIPSDNINQLITYMIDENIDELLSFVDKLYYQSIDYEYLLKEIISIFHQTAIFMVTKKISDNIYSESIKKLSEKYSEEEIQILYQIGVSNLKDIEYAPNYKSGFEMAIIRMLIFTPFEYKEQELNNFDIEKKKKIVKAEEIERKKTDDNLDHTRKDLQENIYDLKKNWKIVINRLEIDAITKNLANNIVFKSKKENNYNFYIEENLISLITEQSKKKLEEALSGFLKESVNITIENSKENLITINSKKELDYNKKIDKAEKQIENNDFVKTIKEKFDATSINNSTKITEQLEGE